MKLTSEPFERIKNGSKVIEVRLFDEKRRTIELGDKIKFTKLPELVETLDTEVIGLSRFKSFKDFFLFFGKRPFGHPEDMTLEDQIEGMREIYSKEKENEFGVMGIHIKLSS